MQDYFELMGLPRAFGLDGLALRKKYLELSRLFHPDFHTTAGAEAQREAEEKSAQLNLAWNTLREEQSRLEYLIRLEGIGEREEALPPDFLMEMMELNERMEEDGLTEGLQDEIQRGRDACRQRAVAEGKAYDAESEDKVKKEHLRKAWVELLSLKYYDRLGG